MDDVSDALFPSSLAPSKQTHGSGEPSMLDAWQGHRDYSCSRGLTKDEATFRHSGWAARRSKIFDALQRLHRSSRSLESFANCGSSLYIEQCKTEEGFRVMCDKCRHRCCVACGRERAAILVNNLTEQMKGKVCRFVTFGLRHSRTPLEDQLDRLYRCFNILRRRKFWVGCVAGGGAFLEVKISEKDGLWHPHLHLIVTGDFIDQRRLSEEWLAVTGDSSIVDVRLVRDGSDVARYVAKYVTKPLDSSVFDITDNLDEAIVALSGRRLCLTFGDWRGKQLTKVPKDGLTWESIGSATELVARLRSGERGVAVLMQRIIAKLPKLESLFSSMLGLTNPGP